MRKVQSYTRSMGEMSMVNNVNGKETKQKTDWNGDENDLTLKNTPLSTISQNKKFQQFVQKLTKANQILVNRPTRANSYKYRHRRPRPSRGRRRPAFLTRRRRL